MSLNAPPPIVLTDVGIISSPVIPEHFLKASAPIDVIESVIIKLLVIIRDLPWNALLPILVTVTWFPLIDNVLGILKSKFEANVASPVIWAVKSSSILYLNNPLSDVPWSSAFKVIRLSNL